MGLVHLHICRWYKNNGDCFYQKACWQKALWNRYTTTFSGFGQIFSNSRFDKDCVIEIFVFAKGTRCVLNAKAYACLCPRSLYWWVFFHSESGDRYVVTVSHSYRSPLPPFLSRKETRATCVCVCVWRCGCIVCASGEDERSHSYYIKQDFPEQSAPATELPKSSTGFPLQQKVGGLAESPLFVLEHHCSGGAEAMSQHRRHSAHLPRIAQLLNVWLLLCHLAFPHGIYSGRNHSHAPMIGWRKACFSFLKVFHLFLQWPQIFWSLILAHGVIQRYVF